MQDIKDYHGFLSSKTPGGTLTHQPRVSAKPQTDCETKTSQLLCKSFNLCVFCLYASPFPHTHPPETVIYPSLSLFILHPAPPHPFTHPCCSPVSPQINSVHSAQTHIHSLTIFNHWLQKKKKEEKSPLESPSPPQRSYSRLSGAHKSIGGNTCTHPHTRAHDSDKLDQC